MKTLEDLYAAFLSKLGEDEWLDWDEEDIKEDFEQILEGARPYFKFPRASLEVVDEEFVDEAVGNSELQVLATYMKVEWLERTILTWEQIKPNYDEKDFSQGNLIDKLNNLRESTQIKANKLQSNYYRSIAGKPYDYSKLSGG